MKNLFALLLLMLAGHFLNAQNVGIGTQNPQAPLHVQNGSILGIYQGYMDPNYMPAVPYYGTGSYFLWYAHKGAFRATTDDEGMHKDSLGKYSFAAGHFARALGDASTAMGTETAARGDQSFAGGYKTISTDHYAFAYGNNVVVSGESSMAMGENISVSSTHSFAGGLLSSATAPYSFAYGQGARASGAVSFAFGLGAVARNSGEVTFGSYNDTTNANQVFSIGAGGWINTRRNLLTVQKNGNVGIGTNLPTATLHVRSASNFAVPQQHLQVTADSYARLRMSNTVNPTPFWDIAGATHASISTNASLNFYYAQNGSNGIDVLSLKGNGNATLAGTLTQNSDERLKKNISRINDPLEALGHLSGYHYQWKDEARDAGIQTGLLAQEVEQVMPELVKQDEKGTKSVNYMGMVPYLLEAVKALKLQNEKLTEKIATLEKK